VLGEDLSQFTVGEKSELDKNKEKDKEALEDKLLQDIITEKMAIDKPIEEVDESEAGFSDDVKQFLKDVQIETNPLPPNDVSMNKTLRTGQAFDPTLQKPMRNVMH